MKLSGHNFDNDVFNSLLDTVQKDIVILKQASKNASPVIDLNFSSTTAENFNQVVTEELKFIASELMFAAKKANVEISGDDLTKFAQDAKSRNLRGKDIQRAASKYCNHLERKDFKPVGTTKISSVEDLISSAVCPAYYPEDSVNNSQPCKYMGMSKNPNSIWDTDALSHLASNKDQLFGDEQIKHSKQIKQNFKEAQQKHYQDNFEKLASDTNLIKNSIASQNVSTVESSTFNPKLPANSMSMFSNDRDFNNIAEKTAGELIKEQSQERSEKKAASKDDWNKIASCKKADHNAEFLFNQEKPSYEVNTKSQRSATDYLFDGLLSYIDKKSN